MRIPSILKTVPEIPFPRWTLGVFFVNLVVLLLLILKRDIIPPFVPLFYGKPTGEEQLAPNIFLIIPTVSALVILVINTILSKSQSDPFLSQIFIGLSITMTVLSVITTMRILFLITSL